MAVCAKACFVRVKPPEKIHKKRVHMTLQNQVELHKALSKKIEELEAQKKELGLSIMKQMTSKTMTLPGFIVRYCSRLSIKLSIEEARSLNAVKLEETVDKDKIKTLHASGQILNGVSKIEYIQVSTIK